MDTDAFSAGVEPGGLLRRSEIRLLLCYLLQQVNAPLASELILSVIQTSGLANYFEAAAALDELQKNGSLEASGSPDTPLFALTPQGVLVAESLSRNLPASVRKKSVQTALELLTNRKREQENKVSFHSLGKGYLVKCRIPDGATDLFSVELRVPDLHQAEEVKRRFMRDPAAFYAAVMALLTGDPVLMGTLQHEIEKLTQKPE